MTMKNPRRYAMPILPILATVRSKPNEQDGNKTKNGHDADRKNAKRGTAIAPNAVIERDRSYCEQH
jgi:hypothetical protein